MSKRTNGAKIARLMYLMKTNKSLKIPPKLIRLVPGGEWLNSLSHDGPGAAGVDLNLVDKLLEQGAKLGEGDVKEGVVILQQLVDETLREDTRYDVSKRLAYYRLLDNLTAGAVEDTEVIELSDPGEIRQLEKFDSGFSPLDIVTCGLYQAILMILAQPGGGKTSFLISILEEFRKSNHEGELLYVESEIPANMMKGRMYDVFQRTKFLSTDRMICGPWNADNILEYVKENPDPNRIILYDSPDVMTSNSAGEGKRFYLENQFLRLIEIKRRSKLVVVSSWPNRKSGSDVASQFDVSECIGKSWYSDIICAINLLASGTVQLRTLKNRFGPNMKELTFNYDYANLTWDADSVTDEQEFWENVENTNGSVE